MLLDRRILCLISEYSTIMDVMNLYRVNVQYELYLQEHFLLGNRDIFDVDRPFYPPWTRSPFKHYDMFDLIMAFNNMHCISERTFKRNGIRDFICLEKIYHLLYPDKEDDNVTDILGDGLELLDEDDMIKICRKTPRYIPYYKPDNKLSHKVMKLIKKTKGVKNTINEAIVLKNHDLVRQLLIHIKCKKNVIDHSCELINLGNDYTDDDIDTFAEYLKIHEPKISHDNFKEILNKIEDVYRKMSLLEAYYGANPLFRLAKECICDADRNNDLQDWVSCLQYW
jgi:hypothetical protein